MSFSKFVERAALASLDPPLHVVCGLPRDVVSKEKKRMLRCHFDRGDIFQKKGRLCLVCCFPSSRPTHEQRSFCLIFG